MAHRSFAAIGMTLAAFAAAPVYAGAPIDAYLSAAAQNVPASARQTLSTIDGAPRKLLALRAYLRAGDALTSRWSWTREQMDAFARTPRHRRFMAEVERVQAAFHAQNPGYTLIANTEVRSLEVQLQRWNENDGVAQVAKRLHTDAARELAGRGYPRSPDAAAAEKFATFLRSWRPPTSPPLAAPGLSPHGQLRAIDFHVERNGRLIASTTMASVQPVWEAQGWARKLQRAAQGARFVGPLKSPNEPWHYEYVASETE